MNKTILSCAVSLVLSSAFVPTIVSAQEVKADNEVSFNLGLVSDYRYRGISQTRLKPALQGGADFTQASSGFYAGAWLSTIKWTKDAGGSGDIEVDLYAGKRGEITSDISYDVGVLTYVYPSNGLSKITGFANANTTEIYGQVGTGPFTLKYSHSTTNLFGFVDSKGSSYIDLSANLPMPNDVTLNLHAGRQMIKRSGAYSYNDWKLGVSKEYWGMNMSLAIIGTNANNTLYLTPTAKFTGKTALVLSAVKSF
jgi:uncharacterized protein (TIGR02001 family)